MREHKVYVRLGSDSTKLKVSTTSRLWSPVADIRADIFSVASGQHRTSAIVFKPGRACCTRRACRHTQPLPSRVMTDKTRYEHNRSACGCMATKTPLWNGMVNLSAEPGRAITLFRRWPRPRGTVKNVRGRRPGAATWTASRD